MKHGIKKGKLSRSSSHRKATLASLAQALIKHEQIITTLPKAKELKPYVEKLITLGKKGGLANYRKTLAQVGCQKATKKLFDVLGARYKDRKGGYTRIMKMGFRVGDQAERAVIEFIDRDIAAKGQDSGPKQNQVEAEEQAQPAAA